MLPPTHKPSFHGEPVQHLWFYLEETMS
jgi:hypothetical protein